jgi:hypothetical protein
MEHRVKSILGYSDAFTARLKTFSGHTAAYTRIIERQHLRLDPPKFAPIDEAHNHYMKVIYNTQLQKISALGNGLIRAIEGDEFLVYGLMGRSLLEHISVWRYFLVNEYSKIITSTGMDDFERGLALIEIHKRFLFGTKFDWSTWLSGGNAADTLESAYLNSLNTKAGKYKPIIKSVQVGECVRAISSQLPKYGVYYDLFCDFVHPNVGSNLLGYSISSEGVLELVKEGDIILGRKLIEETFPHLADLTFGQVSELTKSHFSMLWGEPPPQFIEIRIG